MDRNLGGRRGAIRGVTVGSRIAGAGAEGGHEDCLSWRARPSLAGRNFRIPTRARAPGISEPALAVPPLNCAKGKGRKSCRGLFGGIHLLGRGPPRAAGWAFAGPAIAYIPADDARQTRPPPPAQTRRSRQAPQPRAAHISSASNVGPAPAPSKGGRWTVLVLAGAGTESQGADQGRRGFGAPPHAEGGPRLPSQDPSPSPSPNKGGGRASGARKGAPRANDPVAAGRRALARHSSIRIRAGAHPCAARRAASGFQRPSRFSNGRRIRSACLKQLLEARRRGHIETTGAGRARGAVGGDPFGRWKGPWPSRRRRYRGGGRGGRLSPAVA